MWGIDKHISQRVKLFYVKIKNVYMTFECLFLLIFFRCWDIIENSDAFWWIIKTPILASILVRCPFYILYKKNNVFYIFVFFIYFK